MEERLLILIPPVFVMRLHAEKLTAHFDARFNFWRVDLDEFKFWIQVLGIEGIENVKIKHQIIEAEDVEFELIGDWIILHTWGKIKKTKLYTPYDPDKPKNLAKCVTVR